MGSNNHFMVWGSCMVTENRITEQFRRIHCESRGEWMQQRCEGIGGSEASIILNENPYTSVVELWESKMQKSTKDISDNQRVKYGANAEKPLIELFSLDFPNYKVVHEDYLILQHKKHKELQYSPDGLIETDTGLRGILEIKTTQIMNGTQLEKWKDGIPQNYYIQILHGLVVTDFDFVILKVQMKFQFKDELPRLETKHYVIYKNDVLEELEYLKKTIIEWWDKHIVNKEKPKIEFVF